MKRDLLRRIDDVLDGVFPLDLVGAPSMDTDYGFGTATEQCLREGRCWRCMKADAVDEIGEVGLCQACLDFLRWDPPEVEPAPGHSCSEWCRCRARLAEVCFGALREALRPVEHERVPKWRRVVRAIREELRRC